MKTAKPFFSNKTDSNEGITLIEEDKVVSEDKELDKTFKSYFQTLVDNLNINTEFMSKEPVSNQSVTDINL